MEEEGRRRQKALLESRIPVGRLAPCMGEEPEVFSMRGRRGRGVSRETLRAAEDKGARFTYCGVPETNAVPNMAQELKLGLRKLLPGPRQAA